MMFSILLAITPFVAATSAVAQPAIVHPVVTQPAVTQPVAVRPAQLNKYSSVVISDAIAARSAGVSENEASSVASVIVSRGMEPKEVTELLQMGERLMSNTKSINAVSLSEMANVLASGYTSMHTQQWYSKYIDYIKEHTSIYDISKLQQSNEQAATHTGQFNRRELFSIYGSLMENPDGRRAIQTFTEVAQSYMKDLGIQARRPGFQDAVEYLYNYL